MELLHYFGKDDISTNNSVNMVNKIGIRIYFRLGFVWIWVGNVGFGLPHNFFKIIPLCCFCSGVCNPGILSTISFFVVGIGRFWPTPFVIGVVNNSC